MEEKLEYAAESYQKWQKKDKMTRKLSKCGVFQIIYCQDFLFCPAKLPFLSCQAPISVLPSSLIFPGGDKAPPAPPQLRLWFPRLENSVFLGPAPATACYQPLLVTSSCVGKPFKRLNSHQDFLRSGKFYSSRRKISLFTENSIIWTGLFEKNDEETRSYWCLRRPINLGSCMICH